MTDIKILQPETPEDFEKYFELRWRILRKPWNQPRGSEVDMEEDFSYHIMALQDEQVIGVVDPRIRLALDHGELCRPRLYRHRDDPETR